MLKFSFIIGYRNRELKRVKFSLDSLARQIVQNFEVLFIDYGSEFEISKKAKRLVESYEFPVKYVYNETRGMFWNRAHALNTGLRLALGEYVIFSDIDLIFSEKYTLDITRFLNKVIFLTHRCYYLPKNYPLETIENVKNSSIYDKISYAYVGLLTVNREKVLEINGYDEYYQVWGAEDTDIIFRLESNGLSQYMLKQDDTTIFHMWHPISSTQNVSSWFLEEQNYLFLKMRIKENRNIGKIFSFDDRPALSAYLNAGYMDACYLDVHESRGQLAFLSFYENFIKLNSGKLCCLTYKDKDLVYSSGKLLKIVQLLNRIFLVLNSLFHYRLVRAELLNDQIKFKDIKDFIQYFIGVNRHTIEDYFYSCSSSGELILIIKKL